MNDASGREGLSAQARPMPLAAPVTKALCPVRSTFTDDGPDVMETSFMSLLRLEKMADPGRHLSQQVQYRTKTAPYYSPAPRGLSPRKRESLWSCSAAHDFSSFSRLSGVVSFV
jgi:hypothetical protein